MWRATLILLAISTASCGAPAGDAAAGPAVSADDVHHFVAAYANFTPADSNCAALKPYWANPGPGLRAYRGKFGVSFTKLCEAIHRNPGRYTQLPPRLAEFDSAAAAVRETYKRFAELHPLTNNPGVYFVVGDGISGGTTTLGRHPMILIGAELNKSAAGLPGTVAHELAHTQQDYPLIGMLTGGPAFLRGTLLRHAVKEGSADFVRELLTGIRTRNAYAEAHEAELWRDFQRDLHSRDYSLWLYNGANVKARGDRPADLGYWMGYRISKAYYDRATDKRRALDDILSIRDFDAFLKTSGYAGAASP